MVVVQYEKSVTIEDAMLGFRVYWKTGITYLQVRCISNLCQPRTMKPDQVPMLNEYYFP
jgi:hypothetical protein